MKDLNQRPNILWICTDQQRYDTIGALGNGAVSTPNLDRLAREGLAFERAYCQSPICTPSRASFLTGMYPSSIRVNRNGNPDFPDFPPLISKTLADAGYTCGLIGKLHLTSAYGRRETRVDDGYSYWQYSHAPRDDWEEGHDYADWVRSKGADLGELVQDPAGVPAQLHQTTWCAEKTIEFMETNRSRPWFASVNIYDPHPPFNPPAAYRDLFDPQDVKPPIFQPCDLAQQQKLAALDFQSTARDPAELDINSPILPQSPTRRLVEAETEGARDALTLIAAYYAMIKLIDDQVGRILAALDESGQREDTIVIFTSDHGETLGDHGLILKGCRFYEGLVRVPLIWSWPGAFKAGVRSPALVELTDIAPTLLDVCGLPDFRRLYDAGGRYCRSYVVSSRLRSTAISSAASILTRLICRMARSRPCISTGATSWSVITTMPWANCTTWRTDPQELADLWDEPAYQALKGDLLQRSFDCAHDRALRRRPSASDRCKRALPARDATGAPT